MKPNLIPIENIKENPDNPRSITKDKFKKLVKSLKEFPEMLKLRPIVVDKDNVILGGNMRFKAATELGIKKVYVIQADELTDEQKREFIIKDNSSYGAWDFDLLANEWDLDNLTDWGIDVPKSITDATDVYSNKIKAPLYEPKNIKPNIGDLVNGDKYNELVKKIEESNVPRETKLFLISAATRHLVFDYGKIADYYSHASKEEQELFEESALIIIDFDKAIRGGYVELQSAIYEKYVEDYES